MTEKVLVLRRDLLGEMPRSGFFRDLDLASLLPRAEFMERDLAETAPCYKQIIPFSIFRHSTTVFRYKRSAWGRETRLHGAFSIGVGGHVNEVDVLPLFNDITPVEWARDREITEEFWFDKVREPTLVGFVNNDIDEAGFYHLGVIYEYWLDAPNARPREKRLHLQCGFDPISVLIEDEDKYEGWSQIIMNQYLRHNSVFAVT